MGQSGQHKSLTLKSFTCLANLLRAEAILAHLFDCYQPIKLAIDRLIDIAIATRANFLLQTIALLE